MHPTRRGSRARWIRRSFRSETTRELPSALRVLARGMNEEGVDCAEKSAAGSVGELAALAPMLGRVCMAFLGDAESVTIALECIARESHQERAPAEMPFRLVLFRLAHRTCTLHLARLSLSTRPNPVAGAPADARVALASLKPTEREALVLFHVGGLSTAEIATACGLERSVVFARIASGLARLALEKSN